MIRELLGLDIATEWGEGFDHPVPGDAGTIEGHESPTARAGYLAAGGASLFGIRITVPRSWGSLCTIGHLQLLPETEIQYLADLVDTAFQ